MSALASQRDAMLRAWLGSVEAVVNADGLTAENRATLLDASCRAVHELCARWHAEPEALPQYTPEAFDAAPPDEPAPKRRGRPPGTRTRKSETPTAPTPPTNGAAQPTLSGL